MSCREITPAHGWPLTQRGAHDAATFVTEPLADKPEARRLLMRMLSGAFIGAESREDMEARYKSVAEDFRARLREGGDQP